MMITAGMKLKPPAMVAMTKPLTKTLLQKLVSAQNGPTPASFAMKTKSFIIESMPRLRKRIAARNHPTARTAQQ
ncbi:hypothetical protein DK59_2975 [Brucella abortus bv. 4 str. 292]|nr:hypothetical protein DK59_2975 [Brucella abortus bv. 4 str. 292]